MKGFIPAIAAVWLTLGGAAYAQSSPWQFAESRDALTDEVRYVAFTDWRGRSMLIVACNTEYFRIVAKTQYLDIMMGDVREVTWRVDDHAPVTQSWVNMRKSGAAIDGKEAVEMARAIEAAKSRVVIRSGHNDTYIFDVTGSTAAISKVTESCQNPLLD